MSRLVTDIFKVEYGNSLELNKLIRDDGPSAVNFVARSARNNGVTARVAPVADAEPFAANLLTVALGGSVLSTFIQPAPFYTGYHVAVLTPHDHDMSLGERFWWALCIRANQYRYSYGRQANRTLRGLRLPDEAPGWVASGEPAPVTQLRQRLGEAEHALAGDIIGSDLSSSPTVSDLFEVSYGHSLELVRLTRLDTPDAINFVSRTQKNNGVSARVAPIPGLAPTPAGTLSVALGGSVLETFVQTEPWYSGRDIAVLTPRREMNLREKLWWASCIRVNKFRYSYGRQANKTLARLVLPSSIPSWVRDSSLRDVSAMHERLDLVAELFAA